MNLYRIGYKLPDDKSTFDEIKAGSVENNAGILEFRTARGSSELIAAYKSWDFMIRAKKDIE